MGSTIDTMDMPLSKHVHSLPISLTKTADNLASFTSFADRHFLPQTAKYLAFSAIVKKIVKMSYSWQTIVSFLSPTASQFMPAIQIISKVDSGVNAGDWPPPPPPVRLVAELTVLITNSNTPNT
jgi:hypothetical protein